SGEDAQSGGIYVPAAIERVIFRRPLRGAVIAHVRHGVVDPARDLQRGDISLFSTDGEPLADLYGFEGRRIDGPAVAPERTLYRLEWRPRPVAASVERKRWLVVGPVTRDEAAVTSALAKGGGSVARVVYGDGFAVQAGGFVVKPDSSEDA